jgi:hypothetical protein
MPGSRKPAGHPGQSSLIDQDAFVTRLDYAVDVGVQPGSPDAKAGLAGSVPDGLLSG